ncbi:MAG: fused MFS/spermidine synthase [Fretibacterium sp.]|nr:fused MFS/spermidine synthase [Fretibacterium sp.]
MTEDPHREREQASTSVNWSERSEKTGRRKGAYPWVLETASFLCGASVMVLELAGSRVVAPFLGTSLVVWTSLIGVIMASLCLGNWLGGRAADLCPERKVLARIVLLSALCTGALAFAANPVLRFFSGLGGSFYVATVLAAVALFTLPSVLLGMVSPFIVRLAMKDVGTSGVTVGRFSAIGSAGSILGTFLGGFVLISLFPSGVILLMVAGTLALVALLLYGSVRRGALTVSILLFACAGAAGTWGLPMTPVGEHIETPYSHLWIAESFSGGRRVRIMMTDPHGAQSLMYTDNPTELVSDYTKFYDLAFHFKEDAGNLLMLGGGGYCVPRYLLSERAGISMDVVELDPGVTEAARRYFELRDNPGLRIFHEDARWFLNRAARDPDQVESYDAVFMDVFGSWYSIPFHLTTVEAMQAVSDLLVPDGVLIMNVIASIYGPRSGVFHGIYASLSQVFPRVLIFPASAPDPQFAMSRQNLMLLAFKSPQMPDVPPAPTPEVSRLLAHHWSRPFTPDIPAFTDSFAPVERYSLMR